MESSEIIQIWNDAAPWLAVLLAVGGVITLAVFGMVLWFFFDLWRSMRRRSRRFEETMVPRSSWKHTIDGDYESWTRR